MSKSRNPLNMLIFVQDVLTETGMLYCRTVGWMFTSLRSADSF